MSRTKAIRFSGNQLILADVDLYSAATFAQIKESDTETFDFNLGAGKKETLTVKRVTKQTYEVERFISLYFIRGEKYPYPPKVLDEDLVERDNPRPPQQI